MRKFAMSKRAVGNFAFWDLPYELVGRLWDPWGSGAVGRRASLRLRSSGRAYGMA